jgi:hypothetical protein
MTQLTPAAPQPQQREHCEIEKICRLYHNRTYEYRKDLSCGMTCEHDTRTRPHPPAPEVWTSEQLHEIAAKCNAEGLLNVIEANRRDAARVATLATLDELGTMLNSRIAKTEVLDSNHPSPLRKGIILAYRDVEDWERNKRKRSTAGDEHP